MNDDEPFALDTVPSWVGSAILREFGGHLPSVREVEQIPDKHWLATPGVGQTALMCIRQATEGQRRRTTTSRASEMSDDELLDRITFLQEELRSIRHMLRAVMPKGRRGRVRPDPAREPTLERHPRQGIGHHS